MTAIDRTALPMTSEGGGIELRTDDFGAQTVAWVPLPTGADLRPGLAGLPGDLCPCPHWGYILAGRLRMHTADGPQTYEAGQAFSWAPGTPPRPSRTASTPTSRPPRGSGKSSGLPSYNLLCRADRI